jgi:hypothetical protein
MRWGFLSIGVAASAVPAILHARGTLNDAGFPVAVLIVVAAESVIVALAALNASATAVTKEREDGSLDILLSEELPPSQRRWIVTAREAADALTRIVEGVMDVARLAAGAADDAVTLLALTCRCPLLLCPAMNDAMWLAAATRDNVARIQARGAHFLGPVEGHLAEGYDAIGRMVEPEAILARALQLLGVPA